MRILVVGGRGFLGSRTTTAINRIRGRQAWSGVPKPRPEDERTIAFDLLNPSTFSEMRDFDAVVNCADSLVAPPAPALDYALANGITFIESTAHPSTMDRLLRRCRGPAAPPPDEWPGRAVLGMGLFPGMSNVLAAELFRATGGADRIDVAVRINPLSGAGRGTCDLMAALMQEPAIRTEDGHRIEEAPIRPGIPIETGKRAVRTMGVALSEALMLPLSLKVASSSTYMATVPALPGWMTTLLARVVPRTPGSTRLLGPLMRGYFRFLRNGLFVQKPGAVEVSVLDDRGHQMAIRTNDGMNATAYVLAAAVEKVTEDPPLAPGAYLPDEIFRLPELLERLGRLARDDVKLTLHANFGLDSAVP